MTYKPSIVLFDLGGVLVRVGGVPAMTQLAEISDEEQLWSRWLSCRWVREFETGRCSADAFATGVVQDWDLAVEAEEFLRSFMSWPEGALAGASELVQTVARTVPVGCLSNSNALHWTVLASRWRLAELFEWRFLSHELGLIKPDGEIFSHVTEALAVPPEQILFVDDNMLNVAAARAAGWNAYRARGVEEARAVMQEQGLAPPNKRSSELTAPS